MDYTTDVLSKIMEFQPLTLETDGKNFLLLTMAVMTAKSQEFRKAVQCI